MKALLKLLNIQHTLGVNIFKHKTLTKWLSELSQKFHFLLLSWQPAYSYGQTVTSLQHPAILKSQAVKRKCASLEASIGQSALENKNDFVENPKEGTGILVGLTESIKIESFKLRLFNGLYTFWENKRLRWGMLLLMVFAPLSKFFYLLLPEAGFGEYLINMGPLQIMNTIESVERDWYFVFIGQYFWSVGELMAPVLSIFGIFLLFPKKYYPSYLVGVPFGYYLSLLIHRMFFVTDFSSFHGGATTTMTMTFVLLGVVFFMISDKVMFKQNHVKRAAEARIIGLVNMPGMSWNEKEEIIRKEVADVMKVDNELFIKESA